MSAGATVTQADRSRAVWLHKELRPHMPQKWLTDLREGRCENDRILVAFARHRLATAADFAAREAALVEALRKLSDRWFLNGGELTAPAYVEAKALIARAHTTSEAPDA